MRHAFEGITFLMLLLFYSVSSAFGQETKTVVWPYFSYPPYVILDDGPPKGIYWSVREMLWKGLDQYEHAPLEAPFNRSYHMVAREGKEYCFTGLLKRPDRERHLLYSLPIAVGGPHVVVCRKGSLDRYKLDGTVSLHELFAQEDLTACHMAGLSHGPRIDPILAPYLESDKVQVIKQLAPLHQEFRLVEYGRVDFFVSHSFSAYYMYKDSGAHGLEFIPVAEDPEPFVGYVACTKGELGRRLISEINEVIASHVGSEEYYDMFRPWLSEELWPEFVRDFELLVVEPANAYLEQ